MTDATQTAEYMPTPDEIAAACKEIQSTWTDGERERRRVAAPDQTPLVDCRCSECGRLGVSPCAYCEAVRGRKNNPLAEVADPLPDLSPQRHQVLTDQIKFMDGGGKVRKNGNSDDPDEWSSY